MLARPRFCPSQWRSMNYARNAVKHGALSNAEGHVEITSVLDEDAQRFKLFWEEKGGPVVKEPTRRSFGTRLIENSLARLLHGDARLRFEPSGVICEFDFPLASLRAIHPNNGIAR
jgi:two-component sensor histidine kinase